MKQSPVFERLKKLLDEKKIGYWEGAEILQEIGRPYMYRLELYSLNVKLFCREGTDYITSPSGVPVEIQDLVIQAENPVPENLTIEDIHNTNAIEMHIDTITHHKPIYSNDRYSIYENGLVGKKLIGLTTADVMVDLVNKLLETQGRLRKYEGGQ